MIEVEGEIRSSTMGIPSPHTITMITLSSYSNIQVKSSVMMSKCWFDVWQAAKTIKLLSCLPPPLRHGGHLKPCRFDSNRDY